jgi:hypothetical protein
MLMNVGAHWECQGGPERGHWPASDKEIWSSSTLTKFYQNFYGLRSKFFPSTQGVANKSPSSPHLYFVLWRP